MTTYNRNEAIARNSSMLKKAEAKPALRCNGSTSKLASIFEGLILADNKKNKRCSSKPFDY
jgi:hypothetical protein